MNKRTMKKGLAIVLALVMVFAMTATAFAASGNGYYLVGDATTGGPINVKVVIESRQFSEDDASVISEVLDVNVSTMSEASKGFTVRDAMLAVQNDESNGITLYNGTGGLFTNTDKYIRSMKQNNKNYEPALPFYDPNPQYSYALDGWTFRVNGKYPLSTTDGSPDIPGPVGTSVDETPISNGDVIHFYWDYPYNKTSSELYSAKFITPDASYADGTLNVSLKASDAYFDNSMYWHINSFSPYTDAINAIVTLYNADGTQVSGVSGSINENGLCQINGLNLSSGTYYVKTATTAYKGADGYDENSEEITLQILKSTMGYEKIVVQ